MSGSAFRATAAVVAALLLVTSGAAAVVPAQGSAAPADAGPTGATAESAVAAADATELDSCTVIDEPGHYVLTRDIENSTAAVCIDIQASDVRFDGGGHLIEGDLSRAEINESILGPPPRTRVGVGANIRTTDRLSNVTVESYETAGWYHGTLQENVTGGAVTNVVAHDNGGGIIYENSSYVAVTGSNSSNNLILGVILDSRANATTANNRLVNNTATGNNAFGLGVFLSNNSTVANNTATNNGFLGMLTFATSNATVANNTLSNNAIAGMLMDGYPESNVTDNVTGPAVPNLYVSKNNHVEGNDVTGNGYAGIALWSTNDSTFVDNDVSNTSAAPVPAPFPSAGIAVADAYGNAFVNTTAVNESNLAYAGVDDSTSLALNMTTDSATVWFRSTDVSVGAAESVPGAPAGLTGVGSAVTAVGSGTDASLDVIVAYDDASTAGVDESTLALYRYDDGNWSELPGGVDPEPDFVFGSVTDLGDGESTVLAPFGQPTNEPNVTNYQVDFVAGEPIENLSADRLYAGQDRLFRFAFGNTDEGVTETDSAWASEHLRECVDSGHIAEHENATASVSFTVADDCADVTLSLAVHSLPGDTFDVDTADRQELLTATTETYGPGEHTITVELPNGDDEDAE